MGGHGRHVRATWQGYDVQNYLKDLVSKVKANKNIKVLTETTVKASRGSAGRFTTTLLRKGKSKNCLKMAMPISTRSISLLFPDINLVILFIFSKNFLFFYLGYNTIHDKNLDFHQNNSGGFAGTPLFRHGERLG